VAYIWAVGLAPDAAAARRPPQHHVAVVVLGEGKQRVEVRAAVEVVFRCPRGTLVGRAVHWAEAAGDRCIAAAAHAVVVVLHDGDPRVLKHVGSRKFEAGHTQRLGRIAIRELNPTSGFNGTVDGNADLCWWRSRWLCHQNPGRVIFSLDKMTQD
jgi:hypothetical protein